jgi:hypothetical protein
LETLFQDVSERDAAAVAAAEAAATPDSTPHDASMRKRSNVGGLEAKADSDEEDTSSSNGVESLSTESEAESDASDYLHVGVSCSKDFTVQEDRNHEAAHALAQHLRQQPLLPPHPLDPTQPWTDIESGATLPLWHCAFKGCGDVFACEKSLGEAIVWKHIIFS